MQQESCTELRLCNENVAPGDIGSPKKYSIVRCVPPLLGGPIASSSPISKRIDFVERFVASTFHSHEDLTSLAATVSRTEIFPVAVIGLAVKAASSKGTSIGSCWAKDGDESESQQNKTKKRKLMGALPSGNHFVTSPFRRFTRLTAKDLEKRLILLNSLLEQGRRPFEPSRLKSASPTQGGLRLAIGESGIEMLMPRRKA